MRRSRPIRCLILCVESRWTGDLRNSHQPVQWRSPMQEEEVRDAAVEFSWAGEAARHVGTVVHRFLQRMADEGLAAWDERGVDALDDVLSLALKQEGVPAAERESALARVRQAMTGVLGDPRGRWLLSRDHKDARSEHRLAGELNGAFVNVVLDRTFVDQAWRTLDRGLQDRRARGWRSRRISRPGACSDTRISSNATQPCWRGSSRGRFDLGSTFHCSKVGGSGRLRASSLGPGRAHRRALSFAARDSTLTMIRLSPRRATTAHRDTLRAGRHRKDHPVLRTAVIHLESMRP